MRRRARSSNAKAKPDRSASRRPRKTDDAQVRDLEKRLEASNSELRLALDQQTATAEVLRLIGRSPTDVQPVFEAIVSSARRLLGGFGGAVYRVAGDELHLAAYISTNPSGDAALRSSFPRPLALFSPPGEAIRRRAPVVLTDVDTDAWVPDDIRELVRKRGDRSGVWVPMVREGVALGAIGVTRSQPGSFGDDQIALLKTFADQAVIAIENVRLFNETKEALEQQTATSEILRVISTSPTDLQPVLDAVVRSAARFCGADDAELFRLDGEYLVVAAHHGPIRAPVGRLIPVVQGSVSGRAFAERRAIHVADLQAEAGEFPVTSGLARELGFRASLSVPLLREGMAVGTITLRRAEVNPFTDKQIKLLQTFADQAVIAIENVRLFKELEGRNTELGVSLEQQTATAEILRVISTSPTDLQPVLDALARSAVRFCGAYDATLFQVDGGTYRVVAHHGPIPFPLGEHFPLVRGYVTGRSILDRQPVHVVDLQAETREFPEGSAFALEHGQRTTLAVPLLREGEAIGTVQLRRSEARPFTDKQIALLQTFADQAVIAIENVRLFTELQTSNRGLTQALEQQTATSEILRTIARAQTDVQPVFDTIARSAVKLCRGYFCSVFRFDGERLHLVAHHNFPPDALAAYQRRFPMAPHADYTTGRAILTRAVVHVPDFHQAPDFPLGQQLRRTLGSRAGVAVPMLRDREPIGVINVGRAAPEAFTGPEIDLLKTFADQAVIALENARLFKELEGRTEELTRSIGELRALGEVGQAVSSTLDLETVLTTIVSRAVQLSGTDGGSIYEYDEGTEEFVLRATHNLGDEYVAQRREIRLRKGEGVSGRMALSREPVQVPDITAPGTYDSRLRGVLLRSGARAVLAVPLLREDHLIGGLVVNRNAPGEFPPEVVELLKTFATQSALAIQNARLFHEIADKSRQLEAASRHKSEFLANMSHELRTPLNAVIGFSEVLIQRMFGELNAKQDEYLKDIYASGQHLLSLINDILDLSKIEAGRMELAPAPFHLPAALENAVTLVKERANRHGITLQLDIDRRLGELVGDERKVKQVLLNLLSNAVKFTPEGGRISLKAGRRDGAVEIAVTDTGIGIAPEDQAAIFEEFRQVGSDERKREGTGLGLTLAKKFVELHGGRIWVQSAPGRGSTFTFTLPVS